MNLRETIKRILSEELDTTKSNYEKQVAVLKKLLKSKDYEGVCRYNFTHDEDNDRVASVIVIFSSDWYRQNEDSKYLNIQLIKIQTTKLLIKKLAERFLGIENLYVGSYLEDCNSSLNEQQDTKSNYEKQVELIEKLLKSQSYEGVCGFRFIEDEDDDRVRSIMIKFSEVWYLTDDDSLYLNKKLRLIQETKKKVADIIGRYLNLDNIYVGSYLQECNSSLNEQQDTKSNYEKQVAVLKRLLKSKSYDGLCGYSFTADSDNDEVSRVNLRISSKWDRLSNDQLGALSQAEDDIRDICKKFLGMENLNIRYYLEDCDSSLNEETTPKDDAFQRVLKKVIPDGSTHKYSYSLPYSDEGEVKVIMKYSPLSSSRLMKMVREDGTFYNGIQLNLQIDELIWKSDFDKEWEQVKKTYELPTRFWSEFEDEMSDKFRKAVGMGYVDVYYRNPDTITQ